MGPFRIVPVKVLWQLAAICSGLLRKTPETFIVECSVEALKVAVLCGLAYMDMPMYVAALLGMLGEPSGEFLAMIRLQGGEAEPRTRLGIPHKEEATPCIDALGDERMRPARANIEKCVHIELTGLLSHVDGVDFNQYSWPRWRRARRGLVPALVRVLLNESMPAKRALHARETHLIAIAHHEMMKHPRTALVASSVSKDHLH